MALKHFRFSPTAAMCAFAAATSRTVATSCPPVKHKCQSGLAGTALRVAPGQTWMPTQAWWALDQRGIAGTGFRTTGDAGVDKSEALVAEEPSAGGRRWFCWTSGIKGVECYVVGGG